MPLWWWIVWTAFDAGFMTYDLIAVNKPLGWIFAGIMLVCGVWNVLNVVKSARTRRLSPERTADFWTRDA